MSWDSGPTEPWKGDGEDGGLQVNAGFEPDNAGFDTGNAGELGGGDVGGGDNGGDDDPTCRV